MTTVGYGEVSPKTSEGKIVAVFVMLVGIGTALQPAILEHQARRAGEPPRPASQPPG